MSRPRIISGKTRDIWANHEARVLEIFEFALKILQSEPSLPSQENELNRKLCFCVRRANRQLQAKNRGIDWPLFYEGNNQPDADDETRASREDKRPDFQWGVCDHQEPDPEKSDKYYTFECKRLGTPSSSSWVLNENYVLNGISRFINAEWGYGKSSRSGAMIGYIQNMNENDILIEVNNAALAASLTTIILSKDGWKIGDVSRLEQKLDRPDVPPTPFDLRHLWVDLRHH
jgi:hypothetical protein